MYFIRNVLISERVLTTKWVICKKNIHQCQLMPQEKYWKINSKISIYITFIKNVPIGEGSLTKKGWL